MKENQARILLVDEESLCISVVQDCLESRGYTVHTTSDGQSAIDLITSWQPDLIILGCRMPDLNGHEICRRIREFSWVPIVMLAASARESDELEGLKSGADDYVTRPFSVNELMARVRAKLRRAEWAKHGDPWHLLNTRDALADLLPAAVE
jgi:DNA-binding response OmpR family regulator